MARSQYKISIVERGAEAQWRSFWVDGIGTNPGRTALKEARNLEEAIRLVQDENPGCTVMREGSSRIGSATRARPPRRF